MAQTWRQPVTRDNTMTYAPRVEPETGHHLAAVWLSCDNQPPAEVCLSHLHGDQRDRFLRRRSLVTAVPQADTSPASGSRAAVLPNSYRDKRLVHHEPRLTCSTPFASRTRSIRSVIAFWCPISLGS